MAKRGVVGVKESSSGKKIQMKTKREGVLLLVQAKGTQSAIFLLNRYIFKAM